MRTIRPCLGVLCAAVILAACTQTTDTGTTVPGDWSEYKSEALGMSFYHPPEYVVQADSLAQTQITLSNGKKFSWLENRLHAKSGSGLITVYLTNDRSLMQYIDTAGSYVDQVKIGQEKKVVRYEQNGKTPLVGYLFARRAPFYGIEFTFPPENEIQMKIISSLVWQAPSRIPSLPASATSSAGARD